MFEHIWIGYYIYGEKWKRKNTKLMTMIFVVNIVALYI